MEIYCRGTARIAHCVSGREIKIDRQDLEWQHLPGDERSMGLEIHHRADLNHPQLGHLSWYVSEYPVGALNDIETDVGSHRLIEDFDYGLSSQPDYQDAVDMMVDWFFERFEDPAHETPYDGREGGYQFVAGGPFDAREELENRFTQQSAEVIELAAIEIEKGGTTDWAPNRDAPKDDEDLDDLDWGVFEQFENLTNDVPEQTSGTRFVVSADRIAIASDISVSRNDQRETVVLRGQALIEAERLEAALAGTNANIGLLSVTERYSDALRSESPSIDIIYAAGIRLENARARLDFDVSTGEAPPLPSRAAEHLANILDLHAVIITSTSRGRELLERAQHYNFSLAETAALKNVARKLSEAVLAEPRLLSDGARSEVAEVWNEIGEGPHPYRANEQAVSSFGNLIGQIIKGAGAVVVVHVLGTGISASGPGVAAISEVTAFTDLCAAFFASHLELIRAFAGCAGAEMGWLVQLCDWVTRAKAKSANSRPPDG